MEKKIFSLEMNEDNRVTKIFRFLLGILCVTIAVYWLVYNFREGKPDWSSWVSSVFLIFFGAYMVWTSLGYGYNFIEFKEDSIRLKNNSFLPLREFRCSDIEKITVYPLKFVIRLKSSRTVITRFGLSDIERNENIKDEILRFAEANNIPSEIKNET